VPGEQPASLSWACHEVRQWFSETNKMPSAQLNALNTAYKPYDISFNLINVTWSINDAWAVGEKADDHAMKKGLRQ
jgi:hypothetical protein